MAAKAHWLVEHAETMPLGNFLDPASRCLAWMFIGAMEGAAKQPVGRPKVSDFTRLIAAHRDAQQVIERREREASAARANQPPTSQPS